jgi:protoporphyrinogen oxidase
MKVAVLGGGIAALAGAHYLLKAGLEPVVLESSARLGGHAAPFEHEGLDLDPFPHTVLANETPICGLMSEVGMLGRLTWTHTETALLQDGHTWPLNTPLDLLRFPGLDLGNRLRAGFAMLHATRVRSFGLDLDEVPATKWLVERFGRKAYRALWEPYLRGRFGACADQVPAYWIWERLNREKNDRVERKGYPRGGFGSLIDRLRDSIEQRGARVRLGVPLTGVEPEGTGARVRTNGHSEHYDAVISTLSLPRLAKVAQGALIRELPAAAPYRALVSTVVIARRQLSRYFWLQVTDLGFPFQGIVETTRVIPGHWLGGRSLIYLINYCDPWSATYREPDDDVRGRAVDALTGSFPHFARSDVEAVRVFRAPEVQPVWSTGYLARRPRPRLGDTSVYLCCEEQAYPRLSTWSTQITLAREAVNAVKGDLS